MYIFECPSYTLYLYGPRVAVCFSRAAHRRYPFKVAEGKNSCKYFAFISNSPLRSVEASSISLSQAVPANRGIIAVLPAVS